MKIDWIILNKKMNGEITEKEDDELKQWIEESDEHKKSFQTIKEFRNQDHPRLTQQEIATQKNLFLSKIKPEQKRRSLKRPMAIAASVAAMVAVMIYVIFVPQDNAKKLVAEVLKTDAKGVVLIVDNQKIIRINDNDAVINSENNISLAANNNLLIHENGNDITATIKENKLIVPRGMEFSVKLPDGTVVWLNAESELTYPSQFTSTERKVILKGEAYFDVEHNKEHPFVVEANGAQIRVYGTEFNINARNSKNITTTLVVGSLAVKMGDNAEKMIKPDQTAFSNATTGNITVENGGAAQYSAWKNGQFAFESKRIDEIMAEFALRYNVDIEFTSEKIKAQRFTGCLSRKAPIAELLEIIENTTHVKIELQNNKVTIKPSK